MLHVPGLRNEHRLLVSGSFVGIDVGADRLHVASLDADGRVAACAVFSSTQLPELVAGLDAAEVVAVDAPAQMSSLPHARDTELAPKFRRARCAEIALGRDFRIWVPFVGPAERPAPAWMETGFAVFEALAGLGSVTIEVFPYAGFRVLADRPLPKKTTVGGLTQRVELLRDAGVRGRHLEMWSHDSLDALLGALVALHYAEARATMVGCGHDESAIWLPEPRS